MDLILRLRVLVAANERSSMFHNDVELSEHSPSSRLCNRAEAEALVKEV